ncbi:MAG: septation protein IspZ [Bdellovibrio sp.]|nr:septation protein IspZ [Bdellovibrio sp.]
MTQVKLGRSFFLVSFLPAILYWYLEAHYPVRTALIGGLTLSVIELSIEYFWTKELHALSKFNFLLIAVLGGLSLAANEGIWFKLQPFFTGIFMSAFMFYQLKKGDGIFLPMLEQMGKQPPSTFLLRLVESHMAIFLAVYAIFMAILALSTSTSVWLFFKTAGFYLAFIFFSVGEFFYLKQKMKKLHYQAKVMQTVWPSRTLSKKN